MLNAILAVWAGVLRRMEMDDGRRMDLMLIFWGLLITGIVLLVRALTNRSGVGRPGPDTALETLRRRYAAGELTKEQFEEMKRTLG